MLDCSLESYIFPYKVHTMEIVEKKFGRCDVNEETKNRDTPGVRLVDYLGRM